MVELRPDVILAAVTPAAVATKALTKSIPIVCPLLADAINLGLIASEARPGGNVTGVSFRNQGLTSKQVELALQMIPKAGHLRIPKEAVCTENLMPLRRERIA